MPESPPREKGFAWTKDTKWPLVFCGHCQVSKEQREDAPLAISSALLYSAYIAIYHCNLLFAHMQVWEGDAMAEEEERQSPARNHNTSSAAIGFIPQNTRNRLNFAHSTFNRSAHSPDVRWQTFSNKNADLSIHSFSLSSCSCTDMTNTVLLNFFADTMQEAQQQPKVQTKLLGQHSTHLNSGPTLLHYFTEHYFTILITVE